MENFATFLASSDFKLGILQLYSMLLHVIKCSKELPKDFECYIYFSVWCLGFFGNIQSNELK